ALMAAEGDVFAGLIDGRVVHWPMSQSDQMTMLRGPGGGSINSLAWLPGGGVPRLLIAGEAAKLDLLVLGDASTAEDRAPPRDNLPPAAEAFLCGVSDNRDHLFVWSPDIPDEPRAVTPIGRLCGHSIQEVALLAQNGTSG